MQEKKIIFGAPGCGKTTYLLNILEEELKTVAPHRIAFVSFTKKGVQEGTDRAIEKFGYTKKEFIYFKTLHAICFSELKASRYDMLAKKDYRVFSKAMNMNFVGYYTEEFYHNDDQYLFMYFLEHNNPTMYSKMLDAMDIDEIKLKHVKLNYVRYKEKFRRIDFTDLLLNTLKYDIKLDIDVAIIDEAQDLTTLQWETCKSLFSNAQRVYIAGDDDQAIYEWSGADINYFLNVEGERTILNKSWRLSSNLLTYAKSISKAIQLRVDKDFEPYKEGGNIYYYNSLNNFKLNDDESYYCLARNNYFLKAFELELKRQTKLFMYKAISSVSENVIFAINHFEQYKAGTLSDKEAIKVSMLIRKGLVNIKELRWFEALNLSGEDIFYYRKLVEHKVEITQPKIMINTIHGVKGGEADNVVLLLDITKSVYQQIYKLSDSELRVLYVACTRARNSLHIVHAQSKYSYKNILSEVTNEYDL